MKLNDIVSSIKEYVSEYNYSVHGDNMYENEIVKSELKSLGIINGDDEMVWNSPDKSLCFEVSRDYSTLKTGVEAGYQYICTINVKNNLNMSICTINFSELDAIRILEGFVEFSNPTFFNSNNYVYIPMNPNIGLDTYSIEIEQVKFGELYGCLFKINKYNPIQEMVVPVLSIPLTFEQLQDLAFHIFFSLLIDIEVPVEYDEAMFSIEDYVITEKPYIFERRKQELQEYCSKNPQKIHYAQSYINQNQWVLEDLSMNEVQLPEGMTKDPGPITPKRKSRKVVFQL